METVWLIGIKNELPESFKVYRDDVEGYINALRNRGYNKFHVAKEEYVIDDSGVLNG